MTAVDQTGQLEPYIHEGELISEPVARIIRLEAEAVQYAAEHDRSRFESAQLMYEQIEVEGTETQASLAEKIGKDQSHVSRCLTIHKIIVDDPGHRERSWNDLYQSLKSKPERPAVEAGSNGKTRRGALPDSYQDAVGKLWKDTERLIKLASDDRYTSNAAAITQRCAPELLRSMTAITAAVGRLDPESLPEEEEARRWWATSLDEITETLARFRRTIEESE